ncbi:MAG: hypothetical protein U0519_02170 [Candidatus Gracilibacteria bacterium]
MKKNKNLYYVVGGVALAGIVALATFSNSEMFQGKVPRNGGNNDKPAALIVSLGTAVTSTTVNGGTSNNSLVALNFKGNKKMTLKSLTLQGYVDCDTTGVFSSSGTAEIAPAVTASCNDGLSTKLADEVSGLALYDGATLVSNLGNVGADGKITFNGLNLVIDAQSAKTLTLKGSVSASAAFGTLNDRFKFGITNSSMVTAIKENGNMVDNIQTNEAANGGINDSGVIVTVKAALTAAVNPFTQQQYVPAGTYTQQTSTPGNTFTQQTYTPINRYTQQNQYQASPGLNATYTQQNTYQASPGLNATYTQQNQYNAGATYTAQPLEYQYVISR